MLKRPPGAWARTSEVAPVRTLELAPPPSDRRPTVRGSSSSSGRRRKGWDPGWSSSSRSDGTVIGRGSRSRALAVRHGVHRRTVRQALASPVPPAKRAPVGRPAPKLGAYRAVIDAWLEADRDAPRKQRHTARRIWRRLVDEHGAECRSVRSVSTCGRAGASWADRSARCSCRRSRARASEAEVDWGEAMVGARRACRSKVHLFVMRASFSGAAFVQASLVRDPAGVPGGARRRRSSGSAACSRQVRYDNLTLGGEEGAEGPPAGRDRPVHRAALALPVRVAVHAGRASKGRMRRVASRARSAASAATIWCPVPEVAILAELNALLLAGCERGSRRGGSPGGR